MNRRQLITEILALVDSDPLNEVDIKPILAKYTAGMDVNQEQTVRSQISTTLIFLQSNDEIDFNDNALSKFRATFEGKFQKDSVKIKSSWKRSQNNNPTATNTQTITNNYGINIQGSALSETDFRPNINPTIVHQIEAPKTGTKTSFGKWIREHITTIVVAIISGIAVGFILYKLGWI